MIFNHFHDAYLYTLAEVYHKPQFYNQPRGNRSREILNYTYGIESPIERICYVPERKTNIIFNFAEALWYLSGSNDLDFIRYYASNMAKYSADGRTLTGTAYGPKLFTYGEQRLNQWERIKEVLREDPDSKRAFLAIFDPNEVLQLENIDVSCTLGLQFFIRDNQLHMSSYMRANDAYRGMLSDVFSFTFLQELMATELGLEVGKYYHNVASVHIYETDYAQTKTVLSRAQQIGAVPAYPFPHMPQKENRSDLQVVFDYEQQLRQGTIILEPADIHRLDIDDYWKQVILLLAVYQSIQHRKVVDHALYQELIPLYQMLVQQKWESYFSIIMEES